ncbi:hypothetical protein BN341_9530 [Helicobacter heilmannii ASB1.4]|uniref:Uncharacterized protein n=1 Tax=Helicobacter heilmannii TaxID=35817 RepID=A0A0K2Y893_HELHE|nr:hypothetical protein BN341_9500 [Helicobacter heilmannii ASB1.4]CCM73519.1 hypothetical protein BN341_9530 [Helicobacter heilmannii ASB1.4]CRI35093.1 hypothetical protein HHE01_00910 [Helicobacter heilmannii]
MKGMIALIEQTSISDMKMDIKTKTIKIFLSLLLINTDICKSERQKVLKGLMRFFKAKANP